MTVDPASLEIRTYPDDVLRTKAHPLAAVTDEVRAVAHRMIELMHEAEGIGLAAPQVGLPWRMFVAFVPESDKRSASKNPPDAMTQVQVYINPVLSNPSGPLESLSEGCLSLPEILGEVLRPSTITITATGLDGRTFTHTAAGLLARCWQHETDHLDGVLILDKMTQISRLKNRTAIRELERSASR